MKKNNNSLNGINKCNNISNELENILNTGYYAVDDLLGKQLLIDGMQVTALGNSSLFNDWDHLTHTSCDVPCFWSQGKTKFTPPYMCSAGLMQVTCKQVNSSTPLTFCVETDSAK